VQKLKDITEDEKKMHYSTRDVLEAIEDWEEILDPETTCLVLYTVLNTINHIFEHKCPDQAVSLQHTNPMHLSTDDHIPCDKYLIEGLMERKYLVDQVGAEWFMVQRWVGISDLRRVLVVVEMRHRTTSTPVVATMIFNSLTEKVTMRWSLSILWQNTLEQWLNMVYNNLLWMIHEEQEWYLLQRQDSMLHHLLGIQMTPAQRYLANLSALQVIMVLQCRECQIHSKV
jgi:hypothetical protein